MKNIFVALILITVSGFSYSQNIGIGTTTPRGPLSFNTNLGSKIILWDDGNPAGSCYGIGIQSGKLQIHTDAPASDIVFGNGSSNLFNETMRIKGSGAVQFPASGGKKIIVFPGPTGDAGISAYVNQLVISGENTSSDIIFGFDDRNNGFTERFRMRGSGSFVINGNSGQPGQVLISGGASSPAGWSGGLTKVYRSSTSSIPTLNNNGDEATILSFTVTTQSTSQVNVIGTVWINAPGCFGCGDATVYLMLNDPTSSGTEYIVAADSHVINLTTISFSYPLQASLPAGTYVFTLRMKKVSGSPVQSANGYTPNYQTIGARMSVMATTN